MDVIGVFKGVLKNLVSLADYWGFQGCYQDPSKSLTGCSGCCWSFQGCFQDYSDRLQICAFQYLCITGDEVLMMCLCVALIKANEMEL